MASKSLVVVFFATLCWNHATGAKQIGKGYSFAYNAGDSSRSEDSNQLGEVHGEYRYISDDGRQKAVRYASGHAGFEAAGEDIVNVPRLIELIRARDALEGEYEPSSAELESWGNADRSYSLAYHAGDSARSEVSHPGGYVTGQYSYLDTDGNKRIVEYDAGPGIGFRVKGDHIHSNIADNTVPSSFSSPNLQLSEYTLRSGLSTYEPSDIKTIYNDDGSVTYSYQTSTESRSETVDRNGNTRGSYTFIGDDGGSRTVRYSGGRGTGFQVVGDGIHASAGQHISSAQVSGALVGSTVYRAPSPNLGATPQVTTLSRSSGLSGRSGAVTFLPSYGHSSRRRDYSHYSKSHKAASPSAISNQLLAGRRALSSFGSHGIANQLSDDATSTAEFKRLLHVQGGVRRVSPRVALKRTVVTKRILPQQYKHAYGLSRSAATPFYNSAEKGIHSTGSGFIRFSTPDGRSHNFNVGD